VVSTMLPPACCPSRSSFAVAFLPDAVIICFGYPQGRCLCGRRSRRPRILSDK
jgi:hypothetical protein